MKKVEKTRIVNIEGTDIFDNIFLFEYLIPDFSNSSIKVFDMGELLKERKNNKLFAELGKRYAMYANVYSEEDEFKIFKRLFDDAIGNNQKIHINGITLQKELELLEEYYISCGYLREDVNCFSVDFSKALITVSVNIENLMWRGSDYKKYGEKIFFIPPIREAGLTKAMFKGINKGVIAGIHFGEVNDEKIKFLKNCLINEHILPLNLAKVLQYNFKDVGIVGETSTFIFDFDKLGENSGFEL